MRSNWSWHDRSALDIIEVMTYCCHGGHLSYELQGGTFQQLVAND